MPIQLKLPALNQTQRSIDAYTAMFSGTAQLALFHIDDAQSEISKPICYQSAGTGSETAGDAAGAGVVDVTVGAGFVALITGSGALG